LKIKIKLCGNFYIILWNLLGDMDQWGELDLAGSVEDPVVGFCEHGNEPSGYIKKAGYLLTRCVTIGFSNNILHHE
jgi:hypothetical protein